MKEFLSGSGAAAAAAQLALTDALIGVKTEHRIELPVKAYEPEFLSYGEKAAESAAIARVLKGKSVFLEGAKGFSEFAKRRLPVTATSPRIHNWCLCLAPADIQQALEDTIAAMYATRNRKVLMPGCVVTDNILQQTYGQAELPGYMTVRNLVGDIRLDRNHEALAGSGIESIAQMQRALDNAGKILQDFSADWKKRTHSSWHPVEKYNLDDAEFAFVTYGSSVGNAKTAARFLGEHHNEKIGVLSLRLVRPFPEGDVAEALQNAKRIAVVDNSFSLGTWTRLFQEIRTVYSGFAMNVISQFTSSRDFIKVFSELKNAEKPDRIWNV